MRVKTGQASSRYLGTLVFLLLLFLNEVFPKTAFAFTTLNDCFKSKECLELIRGSSSSAVSAPTGAGYGVTTLRTTTSSGAIKTFVNGVADFAIVVGPSAAYVGWHYWDEAHNGRAQDRAKQRYCAAYPTDVVCGKRTVTFYSPNNGIWVTYSIPQTLTSYTIKDCIWLGRNYGPALNGTRPDGSPLSDNCGPGIDPSTLKDETTGKVPWKDWPQAKRDRAVTLLNDADWQRLATSIL